MMKIRWMLIVSFFLFLSNCREDKKNLLFPNQESSEYVLPYPVGATYTCIQGYVGSRPSHQGVFYYAIDFSMPIGSMITAARGGNVVYVLESFEEGNFVQGNENIVVIMHPDSTFGRYVHLTKNGAFVEVNQVVAQGDTIGLSGNTGSSYIPHLHFDVTKGCYRRECQTVPVSFKNTQLHPYGLEQGVSYTADPY